MRRNYIQKKSPKSGAAVAQMGVLTRSKARALHKFGALQLRSRYVVKTLVNVKKGLRVNRSKRVVRRGRLVQNSLANSEFVEVGLLEGTLEHDPNSIVRIKLESRAVDKNVRKPEVAIAEEDESEEMDRLARESTPPHLIRDPTVLLPPPPPGMRARPARVEKQPLIPWENAVDLPLVDTGYAELCASDRERCIEKYNFDPLIEKPLRGCYQWEKVDPEP